MSNFLRLKTKNNNKGCSPGHGPTSSWHCHIGTPPNPSSHYRGSCTKKTHKLQQSATPLFCMKNNTTTPTSLHFCTNKKQEETDKERANGEYYCRKKHATNQTTKRTKMAATATTKQQQTTTTMTTYLFQTKKGSKSWLLSLFDLFLGLLQVFLFGTVLEILLHALLLFLAAFFWRQQHNRTNWIFGSKTHFTHQPFLVIGTINACWCLKLDLILHIIMIQVCVHFFYVDLLSLRRHGGTTATAVEKTTRAKKGRQKNSAVPNLKKRFNGILPCRSSKNSVTEVLVYRRECFVVQKHQFKLLNSHMSLWATCEQLLLRPVWKSEQLSVVT